MSTNPETVTPIKAVGGGAPKTRAEQLMTLARLRDDFMYYAPAILKVKTKSGKISQFVPNKAQRYAHARLEEQRLKTGKVRALILKGRQQGMSTYIGGRFYHKAALNSGVGVFILTHEQTATDNLFGMAARYHENAVIRPITGKANAKELLFPKLDSGYGVGTAGQKAVGRSKTIQLFHGSEVAFWPNDTEHFAGVVQAVADEPGTEDILESTANGPTGEFYERWQKAEAGIGDYIAIFVPWFWDDGYKREPEAGFILRTAITDKDEDMTEQEYCDTYKLDMPQMCWRRNKIEELGFVKFKQEYPANATEAFQTSGHDSFIKAIDVLRAMKRKNLEESGPLIVGVDPSRFGDDLFSIAWRRGRVVRKVETIEKIDTVQAANKLKQIIDNDRPKKMFIDAGNTGAAIYDLLISFGPEYGTVAELVNFGSSPEQPEIYLKTGEKRPGPMNRRAEMWERSRIWLKDEGGAQLPDENVLQTEACGPKYQYNVAQRLQLESKEAMRRRKVPSPDRWDSIVLTFASSVYDETKAADYEARQARKKKPSFKGRTGWMGR
jgi:hypothetical protein